MSLAEMKEWTFRSKYANWNKKEKRRETWSESVDRFCDMFLKKYADKQDVFPYIEELRTGMKKKKVLGSQRGLQFGGEPCLRKNARIFNCTFSYCDRARFFQEAMYLLMCGSGVGYSVQKHHVAKLPKLIVPGLKSDVPFKTFVVEDSIEGWSNAIGVIINSYFAPEDSIFPEYSGCRVEFDYSKISPEGTPLSSCRGKSPGHKPLKKAIENIRTVLLSFVGKKLTPLACHDIICHFSDAVISGGVRRSALIALFSHDDGEMMTCKTGAWFSENPQRGRANNSAVLLRDKTTFEDFNNLIKNTREFGEPGFFWVDDLEMGTNPCCEISFYAYTESGESGWEGCNLSTINGSKIKSMEDYLYAARLAAIAGTLQAGFTSFPYLGKASEEIFKREALLGVSITGIMENTEVLLNPENQKTAAELVKTVNVEVADILGINHAARCTCIKPEGTSSTMLGTSSGIHPHHAKRYIRRIQVNKNEPLYKFFNTINPSACETSVWSANNSDDVISFCIEVPDGSKLRNQVPALELLESVKTTQQNWVISGKNESLCTKSWLNHNVSNTITVNDNEWEEVTKYIYENRQYFCGISLLSAGGDLDYDQAPFTAVYLPSEMDKMYGDAVLFASGLIEKAKDLWDDSLWNACNALLGTSSDVKGKAKQEWITRAKRYADRYLNGDIKKLTYCLKHVDMYKKYVDLKREFKPVDYDSFIEDEDNTQVIQEVACSGGSCSI